MNKAQKLAAKRNLKEARNVINHIGICLDSKDPELVSIAEAFFYVFNYHLTESDLRPSHVHMVALLRRQNDQD
jgi:hypothetical protein